MPSRRRAIHDIIACRTEAMGGRVYACKDRGKTFFVYPERLNGDWTLDDKKSQTFSYRVVVHSGDETQAKIADRYADYAKPPKAEWVK